MSNRCKCGPPRVHIYDDNYNPNLITFNDINTIKYNITNFSTKSASFNISLEKGGKGGGIITLEPLQSKYIGFEKERVYYFNLIGGNTKILPNHLDVVHIIDDCLPQRILSQKIHLLKSP